MRIRRSWTRFINRLVLPAICGGLIAYSSYYTLWGPRGLSVLSDTNANLSVQDYKLHTAEAEKAQLQHRIALLEDGKADRDMVEEVSRAQMVNSAPGVFAIPREKH